MGGGGSPEMGLRESGRLRPGRRLGRIARKCLGGCVCYLAMTDELETCLKAKSLWDSQPWRGWASCRWSWVVAAAGRRRHSTPELDTPAFTWTVTEAQRQDCDSRSQGGLFQALASAI